MTKISFKDDYSEGVHPNILQALNKMNLVQEYGYGMDTYCDKAIKLIRAKIDDKKSAIRLVTSWATKEESVESFVVDLKSQGWE